MPGAGAGHPSPRGSPGRARAQLAGKHGGRCLRDTNTGTRLVSTSRSDSVWLGHRNDDFSLYISPFLMGPELGQHFIPLRMISPLTHNGDSIWQHGVAFRLPRLASFLFLSVFCFLLSFLFVSREIMGFNAMAQHSGG